MPNLSMTNSITTGEMIRKYVCYLPVNSHMDKQLDDYWKDKKEKADEKDVPITTIAKTEEKKQEEKK